MKATQPGTDYHAQLAVHADGRVCPEYVLPSASTEHTSIVECFIPVGAGQQLTLLGAFTGSSVSYTADLVVDGTLVRYSESTSKTGNIHRSHPIKFKDALTVPIPQGWTSIEHPKAGFIGNMHVERVDDTVRSSLATYERASSAAPRAGIGSVQVVVYANQNRSHRHQDREWDITLGNWKDGGRRGTKIVRKSGIEPEFELMLQNKTKVQTKRGSQLWQHWWALNRPGLTELARFIFYYRSQEAIDNAGCILRPEVEHQLAPWNDGLQNNGHRLGEFQIGGKPPPRKYSKNNAEDDEENDGDDEEDDKAPQGTAKGTGHSRTFSRKHSGAQEAMGAVSTNISQSEAESEPPHKGLRSHVPLQRLGGPLSLQMGSHRPIPPNTAEYERKRANSSDASGFEKRTRRFENGSNARNQSHDKGQNDPGASVYIDPAGQVHLQVPSGEDLKQCVERVPANHVKMADNENIHLGFGTLAAATSTSTSHYTSGNTSRIPLHSADATVSTAVPTGSNVGAMSQKHIRFQPPGAGLDSDLIGEVTRAAYYSKQSALTAAASHDRPKVDEIGPASSNSATKARNAAASTSTPDFISDHNIAESVNNTASKKNTPSDTSINFDIMESIPTVEEIIQAFPSDGIWPKKDVNDHFSPRLAPGLSVRSAFNGRVLSVSHLDGERLILNDEYRISASQAPVNSNITSEPILDDFEPDSVKMREELEPSSARDNHMQNQLRETSSDRLTANKQTLQQQPLAPATAALQPKSFSTKRISTSVKAATNTTQQAASIMPPKTSTSGAKRAASTATSEAASKRTKKDDKSKPAPKDKFTTPKSREPPASVLGKSLTPTPVPNAPEAQMFPMPSTTSTHLKPPAPTPALASDASATLEAKESRLEEMRAQLAAKKAKIEHLRAQKADKERKKQERKAEQELKAEQERKDAEARLLAQAAEKEKILQMELEMADADEEAALLEMQQDDEDEDEDEQSDSGAGEGMKLGAEKGGDYGVGGGEQEQQFVEGDYEYLHQYQHDELFEPGEGRKGEEESEEE